MGKNFEQPQQATFAEIASREYAGQVGNDGRYVVSCATDYLVHSGEQTGGSAVAFFNDRKLAEECVAKINEMNRNLAPRIDENQ